MSDNVVNLTGEFEKRPELAAALHATWSLFGAGFVEARKTHPELTAKVEDLTGRGALELRGIVEPRGTMLVFKLMAFPVVAAEGVGPIEVFRIAGTLAEDRPTVQ